MARRAKRVRKQAAASAAGGLRRLDEEFVEWRYEPKSSRRAAVGVVLLSLGGLAVGMGVYAMVLHDGEPVTFAPYLLAFGVVLVVAYFLFGSELGRVVRVGELGVGFEDDGKVTRTRWYELEKVRLSDGVLRLVSAGKPLTFPVRAYTPAVQRIVAEAQKRIPKRVEIHDEGVGRPDASVGERVAAEPPQVTQLRCRASDRPLTFEQDARLCGRCGALYHRAAVPRRCLECGKKLKGC